ARKASVLLLRRPGLELPEQAPEPHHRHLALEAAGLFHRRAELLLAPAVALEELRAFRRRELEWRVALLYALPPRPLHHLQQLGSREVDQPPAEARLCVQVAGERAHLLGREIDDQAFGDDERALRARAELREQRLALIRLAEIEAHGLVLADRRL